MAGADAEKGAEGGVPSAAAVEAEDKLVEIGLKVFAAQAVIDTERPDFEIGEDAVHPGQDDVGGHLADDVRLVMDAGGAGITGQPVGLGGGAGGEMGGEEGVQAGGRKIGYLLEADPAGAGTAVLHLDGADDEDLALVAAPAAAGGGILLAAADKLGLVDLDQTGQRGAAGGEHAAAQLGAEQPGALIRAQGELALQLQGGDAVGMGGHQVGRPEPNRQRQFGVVHDGAGGHRGLLAAAGALVGPRLGLQSPRLGLATARADEAIWPARREQVRGAGRLVREAVLEFDQRAREIWHDSLVER